MPTYLPLLHGCPLRYVVSVRGAVATFALLGLGPAPASATSIWIDWNDLATDERDPITLLTATEPSLSVSCINRNAPHGFYALASGPLSTSPAVALLVTERKLVEKLVDAAEEMHSPLAGPSAPPR